MMECCWCWSRRWVGELGGRMGEAGFVKKEGGC